LPTRRFLANPKEVLAEIDQEVEKEEEIINDARLLCDHAFLADAFAAFYCQADVMSKSEDELVAEGPLGPTLPSIYDLKRSLDMGPDLDRWYRSLGLRIDVSTPNNLDHSNSTS
jgi:hypothetical protein